jgi:DUF1365 family protein
MNDAAVLYIGETVHQRVGPRPHRFSYRLFQLLLDVDRVDEATKGLRWLRHGRFGLFSFDEADHGSRDGSPLRLWAEDTLRQAGLNAEAATIRLMAFPRVLGFIFNPISIWFVEDRAAALEAVIYEVNNTFGQTHAYVLPATGAGVQRQRADKRLYVSPFYKVEGQYQFTLTQPDDRFQLTIVKAVDGRPDFTASLWGEREPVSDARLMRLFLSMPLMTLKVVAAIHWEALKLLLKGAPFGARPPGPKAGVSLGESESRANLRNGAIVTVTDDHQERPSDGDRPLVHAVQ